MQREWLVSRHAGRTLSASKLGSICLLEYSEKTAVEYQFELSMPESLHPASEEEKVYAAGDEEANHEFWKSLCFNFHHSSEILVCVTTTGANWGCQL